MDVDQPISALDLSTRPDRCLRSAGIETIRQLVVARRNQLKEIPQLGSTSLREIKRCLQARGLGLGMTEEMLPFPGELGIKQNGDPSAIGNEIVKAFQEQRRIEREAIIKILMDDSLILNSQLNHLERSLVCKDIREKREAANA